MGFYLPRLETRSARRVGGWEMRFARAGGWDKAKSKTQKQSAAFLFNDLMYCKIKVISPNNLG